jgi:hypothetical protein
MAGNVATIADRRYIQFDKLLSLRLSTAPAVAATTSDTPLSFAATKEQGFECVVDVLAHTGYVAATAQWTIAIEVSDSVAGTYVQVGSYTAVGTAQRIQIPLSGQYCQQVKPGAAFIRATATKVGAPGTLAYGAFLNYLDD